MADIESDIKDIKTSINDIEIKLEKISNKIDTNTQEMYIKIQQKIDSSVLNITNYLKKSIIPIIGLVIDYENKLENNINDKFQLAFEFMQNKTKLLDNVFDKIKDNAINYVNNKYGNLIKFLKAYLYASSYLLLYGSIINGTILGLLFYKIRNK